MDVRRDCVSFALSLATCMDAEVAKYLTSGLATSTSLWARARHPCRSRSESKVPHALGFVSNFSTVVSDRYARHMTVAGVTYISHPPKQNLTRLESSTPDYYRRRRYW